MQLHPRLSAIRLATALIFAAPIASQGSPAPGYRLWGGLGSTDTHLVDSNSNIVHTWPSQFGPGAGIYLQEDGLLARTARVGGGFGPAGDGGGLQRIALDGTIVWDFRYESPTHVSHHDIEILPNGNVLMIAWERMTRSEAIANGRDPKLSPGPNFWPDHVVEVRQTGPTTGDIVWEWHVKHHFVQDFDATKANFGDVRAQWGKIDINYPQHIPQSGDYNHCNGIEYDPVNDWVLLSSREQNEIWVIDHSTTTAEAASDTGGVRGRGGRLLYRWGNPAACRRGTANDHQLFGQHAPQVIPVGYPGEGNVVVFNNQHPNGTQVWEFELPDDPNGDFVPPAGNQPFGPAGPVWIYSEPRFSSPFISSAERLPNGNTLICSGAQGWMFEVDPAANIVWQHVSNLQNVFHVHYYDHSFWKNQNEISLATGGTVDLDMIAGTPHADRAHFVLGSVSGTSPGTLLGTEAIALNRDAYFRTTLAQPNTYPLESSFGLLDANGRARATFSLPGGILPPALVGFTFHHAYLVFDSMGVPIHFSNPVGVTILP